MWGILPTRLNKTICQDILYYGPGNFGRLLLLCFYPASKRKGGSVKIVYAAMKCSDLTEGRGPMITIGTFWNKYDAAEAARGWGVMGVGDGEVREIKVYDSWTEFKKLELEDVRQKALSKLTDEERMVLGIKNV